MSVKLKMEDVSRAVIISRALSTAAVIKDIESVQITTPALVCKCIARTIIIICISMLSSILVLLKRSQVPNELEFNYKHITMKLNI